MGVASVADTTGIMVAALLLEVVHSFHMLTLHWLVVISHHVKLHIIIIMYNDDCHNAPSCARPCFIPHSLDHNMCHNVQHVVCRYISLTRTLIKFIHLDH